VSDDIDFGCSGWEKARRCLHDILKIGLHFETVFDKMMIKRYFSKILLTGII